jgi:DNA polymerase-1
MNKLVIIEKESQVEELIHYCKQTGYASIDYETTGLEYYLDHHYPLILGVSFQPGSSWILPLQHKDSPFKKTWQKHFKTFGREVLQDKDIVKVAWNAKFEYKWTLQQDILIKGRLFDAMLAKYCLDEERPHGLKPFVDNFFPMYAGYDKKVKKGEGDNEDVKIDWVNKPFFDLCEYCGIDSDLTLRAMIYMEPKLIKLGFYSLFRNILNMLVKVLGEAEWRGMLVDRTYLEKLVETYRIKIAKADAKLRNTPALLKFEKKHKQQQFQALIKEVELDIAQIAQDNAPNANRLIANRQLKIKGFLEGKFNNKEAKKLEPINFRSPDQLKEFLFFNKAGLRLPIVKYTKNKDTKQFTENPSTDEEVLLELKKKDKSGFIKNLLKHREIVHLDSTYISGMLPRLDRFNRVHTNYKINGTVTGRLSSVDPNLQNIPRGSTAKDIKRMFIPPKGYLWWEDDYSQAELRIVAEVSGDKAMIEIFAKNYNPHVATGIRMKLGKLKDYDKIKAIIKVAEQMDAETLAKPENKKYLEWVKAKKKGKSMNFSVIYQQGIKATAEQMKVSEQEAAKFQREWYAQYPGAKKWVQEQKRLAHEQEWVPNLFGGKRRLHDINCGRNALEAEAERQAVNAPIQGSSGYFTLFSMVIFREEQLKGNIPLDCTMQYTTHDSIGGYIRPEHIHAIIPLSQKICENPQTLKYFGFEMQKVRMKTAAEIGFHWAALRDYLPEENYKKLYYGTKK